MNKNFKLVINELNNIIKLEKDLENDLFDYNYELDISPSIIVEYYNIILKNNI